MSNQENGRFIQLLEALFTDLEEGNLIESDITFYSFLCNMSTSNKTISKSIKDLASEYIVSHNKKSIRSIHGHLSRLKKSGHVERDGSLIKINTFVKNKNEYFIKGKKFKRQ